MIEGRYDRNKPTLNQEDQEALGRSTVAIFGVGGLGGWQAQILARIGVGKIILIDGDDFQASNLNRQVFSTEENLGCSKVEEAKKALAKINSETKVETHHLFLENLDLLPNLKGCDLIMDGADNLALRKLAEDYAQALNIPWIHGAIAGWEGQFGIFTPESGALGKLYPAGEKTQFAKSGNLSFVVANTASSQVNLAVQHLLGRETCPYNRLCRVDFQYMDIVSFEL